MKIGFDYFPVTAHHILCYSRFDRFHLTFGLTMLQSSHFALMLLDVEHCYDEMVCFYMAAVKPIRNAS